MKKLNLTFFLQIIFVCSLRCSDNVLEKKEIRMWEQGYIEKQPDEQKKKSIFTNGLFGCVALALITRFRNGSSRVMMSHYSPINRGLQVSGLEIESIELDRFCGGSDQVELKKLIILVPGEYERGLDGKYNHLKPQDSELGHIEELGKVADTSPLVCPYSEEIVIGIDNDRNFEVRLENDKIIWNCFADFNRPHKL